jgi:hypothetical protein
VRAGIVEVGDAILYLEYNALSTLPQARDLVIDGTAEWEIIGRIEQPRLGVVKAPTMYAFRCKRRIISADTT